MDYKIIKREREKAGISQTDFAKMIKVTKQTLYKYEQGIITNIPSNKIEEIANALGLSPAYLMGWDDDCDDLSDISTAENKASKIAKRIAERRTELGYSFQDLSNKTNISIPLLKKYESGIVKRLTLSKIKSLADALEVSPSYLMGWDDEKEIENSYPLSNKEYIHITKYRRLDTISKNLVDLVIDKELERINNDCTLNDNVVDFGNYKEIPCYPRLASAGTGEYLFDDIPTNTIKIDTREYPKADYAIQVNGDSMEPTYYDGDTLIVERNAVPEKGQIGIFILDNEGYVKRMGNGELISDNKIYPNIICKYGECLGRVLGKL